jgi:hypothetical protein
MVPDTEPRQERGQRPSVELSEECRRIRRRTNDFNWKNSNVWGFLRWFYGSKLRQAQLVAIAEIVSARTHIRLDRDARRRKIVLIKWFEENWWLIYPWLHLIQLRDASVNAEA